jgi:hypothetical protein
MQARDYGLVDHVYEKRGLPMGDRDKEKDKEKAEKDGNK